jgi:DNA repair exonuclease SbcCD nuclease subunit
MKKTTQKSKPKFVLISDIHFNLSNLELSAKALQAASEKAEDLNVPLVIAGDLNDTKAIIRAEVANKLLEILETEPLQVYILVGNHDLINEKGKAHGLTYLSTNAHIIDTPQYLRELSVYAIPYMSDNEEFKKALKDIPEGSTIIMHQGVLGAEMGDYVTDKSSVNPALLKPYRVFSGHYHRHQTIGTVTYIGNPFSMSFGEANDPLKGYLIVNEDDSYERVLLGLRKHVISEWKVEDLNFLARSEAFEPDDILLVKVTGDASKLAQVKKEDVAKLVGHNNFRLDKIPTESKETDTDPRKDKLTGEEILDTLIEGLGESKAQKKFLKDTWRKLLA